MSVHGPSNTATNADLGRELDAIKARHRHWCCDRCSTSLTLSSPMVVAFEPHLLKTALALGWSLSDATVVGLSGSSERKGLSHDLCAPCIALADQTKPLRRQTL